MPRRTLRLRSTPDWHAIDSACAQCASALREGGVDVRDLEAIAMAARELLENAVKYGAQRKAPDGIAFSLEIGPAELTVSVANRVGEGGDHLERILGTIARIRGFADPFDAYAEMMERVASEPRAGGLGLARIAAEGACVLSVEASEGGVLVSATRRRGEERR